MMFDKELTVVAIFKVGREKEDVLKHELNELAQATRQEQGCLSYILHSAFEKTGHYMVYENWRSREDFERHLQTTHFNTALAKAAELLDEPAQVTWWLKMPD